MICESLATNARIEQQLTGNVMEHVNHQHLQQQQQASCPEFQQANVAFQQKDYEKAERLYTEALEKQEGLQGNTATIYSNRAACRTRIAKYKLALEDAERCIRLAPNWPKGYYRMARGMYVYVSRHSGENTVLKLISLLKLNANSISTTVLTVL